jgi:Ca2+-binding EF-hand superfamily protein
MEETISELRVLFDSFDKDKNGILTKKELKEMLKVLEVDTSKAHVEMIFNAIDDNNDGKITFEGMSILS